MPTGPWHTWADQLPQWQSWLAAHGQPLLLGVPVLGLLLASLGYVLVMSVWRWAVLRQWRNRKNKRGSDRKAVKQ